METCLVHLEGASAFYGLGFQVEGVRVQGSSHRVTGFRVQNNFSVCRVRGFGVSCLFRTERSRGSRWLWLSRARAHRAEIRRRRRILEARCAAMVDLAVALRTYLRVGGVGYRDPEICRFRGAFRPCLLRDPYRPTSSRRGKKQQGDVGLGAYEWPDGHMHVHSCLLLSPFRFHTYTFLLFTHIDHSCQKVLVSPWLLLPELITPWTPT